MKGKIIHKKRIKGIIIIVFLIIAMTITKVNANTMTLTRNKIDGIYAIAPLSDRVHLYNLEIYKLGTSTAYCIEIGKPVSENYTGTLDMTEASRITGISKDKINYVRLITYFGYGYKNHSDYKYYMAAQELIWEYLNNIDITWTNELDVNGPKINIDTYKNEIKSLINKYNSNLTFEDRNCKIGGTLILTDSNSSLDLYSVTNQGRGSATITNNKTLTINVANNYIGKDIVELKTIKNYSGETMFYYANTYQSLLTAGNIPQKTKTININIFGETLTTNLIDKDNNSCLPSGQATLTGAEYELYDKDNNLITTFTTNETCKNTIPNLLYGTYYIKQTKASTGYKLNNQIITINLTKDNKNTTLEEEVIKSNIEIYKLYEVDENYQREEGIVFNAYDINNNLYKTLTTTKNGQDIIVLPYGSYTIKQMNTTYGYDTVKDISITINEDSNTEIKYDLVNKQIKSLLHITTKDNKTKEKIQEKNIKYKIKDKKTNKYIYIMNNSKKITTFTTNEHGELNVPVPLSYGEYLIEQISTPDKYLKNKEKLEITINEDSIYSYIDNNVVINVDYYNEPITGQINILTNMKTISKNEDNTNSLKEDIRPNIEIELYQDNTLLNTYKTDDEGQLTIEHLSLGNYCIKEKNNNNKRCLEIINTDAETPIIIKNIELTTIIKLSNVTISNIDNLENPIQNSTFILYQNDQPFNESITNKEGIIKINNLSEGNYCFKQIKVSDKYYLNDKKVCFKIKNDGKDIKLKLINNLIPNKKISVPNTLSNRKKSSFTLPITILFILGVILYKKKNTINHN